MFGPLIACASLSVHRSLPTRRSTSLFRSSAVLSDLAARASPIPRVPPSLEIWRRSKRQTVASECKHGKTHGSVGVSVGLTVKQRSVSRTHSEREDLLMAMASPTRNSVSKKPDYGIDAPGVVRNLFLV